MAAKSTLNAKILEALGSERLSELLIELSTGNVAAKRRLRLELAGASNPEQVAKEVRKFDKRHNTDLGQSSRWQFFNCLYWMGSRRWF